MNVICTDGTSFQCGRYELTEKGVKLYTGEGDEAPDRYGSDTEDHQIGFVPDTMLQYILPEGVRPAGVPAAQLAPQPTDQSPQQRPAQSPQQPRVQSPPSSGAGANPATRQQPQR